MGLRFWKKAGALALLAALGVLGAAAPDAAAKKPLVVKRFLLGRLEPGTQKFIATGARGTTNAMRDNVIMFVFTAPVDKSKLNNRTVKIGIPATINLFIDAPGTFYYYEIKFFNQASNGWETKKLYKSRVIFDPTSRYENVLYQNPYGFVENAQYSVTVPGTDSGTTKVVRGLDGSYNQRTFTTTFGTTDLYLQDYVQPSIRRIEGSDLPGIPLEQRGNVDSKADVKVYFSEPMLLASFTNATFSVYNLTSDRPVQGTYRATIDTQTGEFYCAFRPAIGYGKGPSDIEVVLSTDILDRSKNPLNKGASFQFQSELDEFAPNYQEFVEDFTDPYKVQWDGSFGLANPENGRAVWNYAGNPPTPPTLPALQTGILTAAFGSGTKEVNFGSNGGWNSPPMWTYNSHSQMLYTGAQMTNTARTLTGYALLKDVSLALAQGTYVGTTVQLGHNTSLSLNTNFTGSFSDTPVTVVNNVNYTVNAGSMTDSFIRGPTFSTNWAYNGTNNIVLDVNVAGSANPYNRLARGNTGNGGIDFHYVAGGAGGGTANYTGQNLSARWFYLVDKCEAQSLWYDVQTIDPSAMGTAFLDPIVTETEPAGTSIGLTYQGANDSPSSPDVPDPVTFTAWTTDPRTVLYNYRYIRFHADMTLNISTNAKPTIDRIIMPFIWY